MSRSNLLNTAVSAIQEGDISTFLDFIQPPIQPPALPYMITNVNGYIKVYIDMPDFKRDSISVDFINMDMIVKGNREKSLEDNETILKNNIKYGKFSLKITLPIVVANDEMVSIAYKKGSLVVKIQIPTEENQINVSLEDEDDEN